MQNVLTAADLGLMIGVSEKVIEAWVDEGLIPYRRENGELRFDRMALEKWIEEKAAALENEDW